MMKKEKGFTLAEVLITLAIIGVVAAIATPALNSAIQKSKVGPTLRKFISTMENANELLLANRDDDVLSAILPTGSSETAYYDLLKTQLKGSYKADYNISNATPAVSKYSKIKDDTTAAISDVDGCIYTLNDDSEFVLGIQGIALEEGDEITVNGAYKGQWAKVYYDINGFSSKPNKLGKDIFAFVIDDGGTVIPVGGLMHSRAYTITKKAGDDNSSETKAWNGEIDPCNETTVGTGANCSGSIADNSWKVIYKY